MLDRRRRLLGLIVLAAGIACARGQSKVAAPSEEPTENERPSALVLGSPVDHLDGLAREPMLVQHPNGALFLSGYGSQVTGVDPKSVPNLWTSRDGGSSWSRVEGPAYFPYLVARGAGELAATCFMGGGDEMAVQAMLIHVPEGSEGDLETIAAPEFRIDVWQENSEVRQRDPGGEYLPIVFLADGDLAVAAPIQDLAADRFGFSFRRLEVE